MSPRRTVENRPMIETLEARQLLSAAATPATLASAYSGSFSAGSNTHFPLTTTATTQVRTLTLTDTQSGSGISGALSIVGLGNFTIQGYIRGNHFRAILSGDGSGLISATVRNGNLVGRLFDRVDGVSVSGSFAAVTNSSAATGTATRNFTGGTPTGRGIYIAYYAMTSNDGVKFSSFPAAIRGVLRRRSNLIINLSNEDTQGLLTGTLTIGTFTNLSFTGISSGRYADVIFSSSSVNGEIMGVASGNQLASGSISAVVNGTTVAGTFHSQSVANGVP